MRFSDLVFPLLGMLGTIGTIVAASINLGWVGAVYTTFTAIFAMIWYSISKYDR